MHELSKPQFWPSRLSGLGDSWIISLSPVNPLPHMY